MDQQKISKRYVDRQKLFNFLVQTFGANGYEVEVSAEKWQLVLRDIVKG